MIREFNPASELRYIDKNAVIDKLMRALACFDADHPVHKSAIDFLSLIDVKLVRVVFMRKKRKFWAAGLSELNGREFWFSCEHMDMPAWVERSEDLYALIDMHDVKCSFMDDRLPHYILNKGVLFTWRA